MTPAQLRKKIQELLPAADERLLRMVYATMKEYEASGFDWTVNEEQEVYQRRPVSNKKTYSPSLYVLTQEEKQEAYEIIKNIREGKETAVTLEAAVKQARASLRNK